MRHLLPILIGLPVGWLVGATLVPVTIVVVALWMLLNPKRSQQLMEEMSGGFLDSIRNVSSVITQPTSMDSAGEAVDNPTGGASLGVE